MKFKEVNKFGGDVSGLSLNRIETLLAPTIFKANNFKLETNLTLAKIEFHEY